MRSVVEILSSLISLDPEGWISYSIKEQILQRIVEILAHRAAQPLVKPAFKALECFLSKAAVSPQDLLRVYKPRVPSQVCSSSECIHGWDDFISQVFDWMALADISPAAGKLIVTLFVQLRKSSGASENLTACSLLSWQRWIGKGLEDNPDALENVKNHVFSPLFKIDRIGSLAFLKELNQRKDIATETVKDLDAHSLLQLAAMEVGKKAGLVEEPGKRFCLSTQGMR